MENQAVELAKAIAPSFESTAGDGLLGLAFGTINTVQPQPVHTPVENMVIQADIPKGSELFTAYLTNRMDKVPPFYTFGYIDQVRAYIRRSESSHSVEMPLTRRAFRKRSPIRLPATLPSTPPKASRKSNQPTSQSTMPDTSSTTAPTPALWTPARPSLSSTTTAAEPSTQRSRAQNMTLIKEALCFLPIRRGRSCQC